MIVKLTSEELWQFRAELAEANQRILEHEQAIEALRAQRALAVKTLAGRFGFSPEASRFKWNMATGELFIDE